MVLDTCRWFQLEGTVEGARPLSTKKKGPSSTRARLDYSSEEDGGEEEEEEIYDTPIKEVLSPKTQPGAKVSKPP